MNVIFLETTTTLWKHNYILSRICGFLEQKAKVMRGMERRGERERREGKEKEKVRKIMILHKKRGRYFK